MVKLLISGNLKASSEDDCSFSTLVKRVDALTKSNHGPFDLLLVAGSLFEDESSYQEALKTDSKFSIPVYAIDCPVFVKDGELPSNLIYLDRSENESTTKKCGISTIHNLTICWINGTGGESLKDSGDFTTLKSICEEPAYRGCDVLLSSSWPQNAHYFLNEKELEDMKILI